MRCIDPAVNENDAKGAARGPPDDGEPSTGWAAGLSPHGLALCDLPSRLSATYVPSRRCARAALTVIAHRPGKSVRPDEGRRCDGGRVVVLRTRRRGRRARPRVLRRAV